MKKYEKLNLLDQGRLDNLRDYNTVMQELQNEVVEKDAEIAEKDAEIKRLNDKIDHVYDSLVILTARLTRIHSIMKEHSDGK